MEYPKLIAVGTLEELNENVNRFLSKYRKSIMSSRTDEPTYNKIVDKDSRLDISTHQVTVHIKFWPWVSQKKRDEILNASTAKYKSFNELFGLPEPEWNGVIDKDKQLF